VQKGFTVGLLTANSAAPDDDRDLLDRALLAE